MSENMGIFCFQKEENAKFYRIIGVKGILGEDIAKQRFFC